MERERFSYIEKLPSKIVITEDPMRARILVAHLLDCAEPLFEKGDISVTSGSYKDVPMAVISSGVENDEFSSHLDEIKADGKKEVVHIDTYGSKNEFHAASSSIFEKLALNNSK